MTRTQNLLTGETRYYDQPAEKAVVLAFYQSRNDQNWWAYSDWSVEYGPSGKTVFRGDWAALISSQ